MTEPPLFQLRHVRKQYRDAVAVDVERLDIHSSETLCLLGPTGAGKSSLLRLLAGLERPTSGEILFHGRPWRAEALSLADRRRITLVFQRPALLTRSVQANVEYGARLRHGRLVSPDKIEHMLERLGLARLAAQPADTLSGGQMQLTALARALVLEPDVLLLDEPTANLDPAHVALVEQVIHEERESRQITIVWATHNLFQARRVSGRIALMLNAGLIESARTEQFFDAPQDPRTSDFIAGRMIY